LSLTPSIVQLSLIDCGPSTLGITLKPEVNVREVLKVDITSLASKSSRIAARVHLKRANLSFVHI